MQPFPPFSDFQESEPDNYVEFHFEDVDFDMPAPDTVGPWLLDVAEAEGKAVHEIVYIFCSDEYLRRINVEYLDHDYYTDIITFDNSNTPDVLEGDMFISSERVADNARTFQVSFAQELCRVMVHGLLHLAGYGDKTEAETSAMRAKENFYLQQISHVFESAPGA
jgi:rRNA maturation RNase YbeY